MQKNEELLAVYQANGAISEDINDAMSEFLTAQGITQLQVNDGMEEWLSLQGYQGQYTDMWSQWQDDGYPVV